MKLQEVQIMDVDTVGSVDDDVSLKVDTSQSIKLFNILIESYKNSRSSMIREYVSNAWDAHKEIGKTDKPVIVRVSEDDGGNYIEIIDEGVGMTREFFLSVYSTLLATTKDGSNDQIGGFGIGSKSALAYTNYYYVTTTRDCETNEFAIYRESTKGVKISLLQTLEADEGVSGTKVKIYLNDKIDEKNTIVNTAIKELLYFDNVVIENAFNLHNSNVREYNANPILDGDFFKFKTNSYYNDSLVYDNLIHLVIGNVAYTIDYKLLNLDGNIEKYKIPIALKFNIGELKVHMNRETIIYDDATIALIKEKLQLVRQYFTELFLSQRKVTNYSKLKFYIKDLKEHYSNDYISIRLSSYDIIIPKKALDLDNIDITPKFKLLEILQLQGLDSIINNYVRNNKYRELHEIYLQIVNTIVDKNLLMIGEVSEGKFVKRVYSKNILSWGGNKLVFVKNENDMQQLAKDKYALKWLRNCYIIRDYTLSKRLKNSVIRSNNWLNAKSSWYSYRNIKTEFNPHTNVDEIIDVLEYTQYRYKLGDITSMYAMYKFVKNEVLKNTALNDRIVYNSKTFKVPKEFIDRCKQEEREARVKIYRAEGVIPVRAISANFSNPSNPNATIKEFNLANLNNYKGIVVYGTKNDREQLGKAACILEDRFSTLEWAKKVKAFTVMQVAEANQTPFTKFKNAINVRLLFMSNNKLIVQLYTSYLINQKYSHVLLNNMEAIRKINSSVYKDLTILREYSSTYYRPTVFTSSIIKELDYIRKFSNLIDTRVKAELDRIEQYFEDVEFITTSTIIPETEENVVKILKKFNKKVNWEWYHKPDKPHIEALVELQHTTRFMAYEPTDLINYDKSLKPIEVNKYCLTIK